MRYNIFSVKEAVEVFYVIGFNAVSIDDFIRHFCIKYRLNHDKEKPRIIHMLNTLNKNKTIKIEKGMIYIHNPLTANLKLVINDLED